MMALHEQITVKEYLKDSWSEWLNDLAITLEENGDTLLMGPVVDQAALHRLLRNVRDVAMPLLSVIRVEPGQADASDVSPIQ
jgi:hypothetical protein